VKPTSLSAAENGLDSVGAGYDGRIGQNVIRAVLFDLDGTLLDRDETFRRFLRSQAKRFWGLVSESDVESYVAYAMKVDRHGSQPRPQVFADLAAFLGQGPEIGDEMNRDFAARFPEECVSKEGAEELIEILTGEYRLGLITNGWEQVQERKVSRLPYVSQFQVVLISGVEGVRKPDREIFARALQRIGVEAEEAVFVGDNPESDVAGARGAGMSAVWMEATHYERPSEVDGVISNPLELLSWLETRKTKGKAEGQGFEP
jgi:putative hydrolase of the HAD superfamily